MRFIKKLLQFLITGSFTFIIAACYGAPVSYGEAQVKLRVVDKGNEPVAGLMVNIGGDYYPEYYYTDENGESAWIQKKITVVVSEVPVPAAVWLFGSGLGLLGFMRRRKLGVQ